MNIETEFAPALSFASAGHKALHRLLANYGFSCVMTSDYRIGLIYRHPDKPVEVEIAEVEGDWLAVTRDPTRPDGEQLNSDSRFTEQEWDWMDAASDALEFLRRELRVLLDTDSSSRSAP